MLPKTSGLFLMATCTILRCNRPVKVKYCNLCSVHYTRRRRYGSVHITHTARDWGEAEIALLMAAKLTPHDQRRHGPDPDESLAAVSKRLGRSLNACRSKRGKLERARGHKVGRQWTCEGL